MDYDNIVLINAPFTREIRDEAFLNDFKKKLATKDAELTVIWVITDPAVCHRRMIARNSERDTWKLEHWEEYIRTQDFSIPGPLKKLDNGKNLLLFHNSSDEEYAKSMAEILPKLES